MLHPAPKYGRRGNVSCPRQTFPRRRFFPMGSYQKQGVFADVETFFWPGNDRKNVSTLRNARGGSASTNSPSARRGNVQKTDRRGNVGEGTKNVSTSGAFLYVAQRPDQKRFHVAVKHATWKRLAKNSPTWKRSSMKGVVKRFHVREPVYQLKYPGKRPTWKRFAAKGNVSTSGVFRSWVQHLEAGRLLTHFRFWITW